MPKQKLYCFVDETGQDTKGNFFLVAIVLKEIQHLDLLEKKLEIIEQNSGKRHIKWKRIRRATKMKYLEELLNIKNLKNSIFYSAYKNTKDYTTLTSLTIAKAILAKGNQNYTATVIIDGLNDRERDIVRNELKKLKIKYNKIRGMKDEQNIFLRLCDVMAGFLRESYEKQEYARKFIKKFQFANLISEV